MTALRRMNCDGGIFPRQSRLTFQPWEGIVGELAVRGGRGQEGKHSGGELHQRYSGGEPTQAGTRATPLTIVAGARSWSCPQRNETGELQRADLQP